MRKSFRLFPAVVLTLAVSLVATEAHAKNFVAFSMREAERRLSSGQHAGVINLGRITRIAGMVYDRDAGDLIIVGQVRASDPSITLDDFVVAMRSVFLHHASPQVSIDATPETETTRRQRITFAGGIADTGFGRTLLEADILLKRLALGKVSGEIWGLRSYWSMSLDHARQSGRSGDKISSRFWFVPRRPSLAIRDDVFAIISLDIGVETEVLYAEVGGVPVEDRDGLKDEIGDAFARQTESNLQDLSVQYPVLAKARPLLGLVALAEGIKRIRADTGLDYWLRGYPVVRVKTDREYELIEVKEKVAASDLLLTINGGIDLSPLVIRLEAGDVTALREAVLKSRPNGRVLTWNPPLDGWRIPGTESLDSEIVARSSAAGRGFALSRQLLAQSQLTQPKFPGLSTYSTARPLALPTINVVPNLPTQHLSSRVGGVMLSGAAQISGQASGQVDLSKGEFALIVDGQSTQLSPEVFRRFVTALWSVYYGYEDPGVSIEPIAPGIAKHLVRYIGKVVNTDLGRVMREADYLMKKWVVGTEKPVIPGWHDIDELMGLHGLAPLGVSRRFWFVPEDMRFKRGGDFLLFEDGRMTLKTEYLLQNFGQNAAPADEKFAEFFTEHYKSIAQQYPIYQDLFEYAQLVGLARYLKESGVPLLWFLMANKDLVLTEDSPGTVDALAKGSRHFEGLYVEGGVNLRPNAQYVFDRNAVNAITEALSKLPSAPNPGTSLGPDDDTRRRIPERFSFEVDKTSYSVVPQHSLTSGRDRKGNRYQVDLAIRQGDQPGLELVRFYNPHRSNSGVFGNGWHLLIPYRVHRADAQNRDFLNARIPVRMLVENLLTGERELLTFSTDRYSIAGYVPAALTSSQIIGLFLMSDASYRLADKLGNEFWFNQKGHLTDMVLSDKHHVHLEYADGFADVLTEMPAVQLQPANDERMQFLNALIPKRMRVDAFGESEMLVFGKRDGASGYVPDGRKASKYRFLALMSDGSFRLLDGVGNEFAFDPAGKLVGVAPSPGEPLVTTMSIGSQKVKFGYAFDRTGRFRVARATYGDADDRSVYELSYEYDREGRLARVTRSEPRVVATKTGSSDRLSMVRGLTTAALR